MEKYKTAKETFDSNPNNHLEYQEKLRFRTRLSPRKALSAVSNLLLSPVKRNIPEQRRSPRLLNNAGANEIPKPVIVSPSKFRHRLFAEEAQRLGPDEKLQPCPRCTCPSRYGKKIMWNQFCDLHSLEISGFFYHSDFTWNQVWGFLKCKISHFNTIRGSEFLFLWIFALSEKYTAPKLAKTPVFALLESTKLISRKFWVMQKLYQHCDHRTSIFTIFQSESQWRQGSLFKNQLPVRILYLLYVYFSSRKPMSDNARMQNAKCYFYVNCSHLTEYIFDLKWSLYGMFY